MAETPQVAALEASPAFGSVELLAAVPLAEPARDGAVSPAMRGFRDKADPAHTVAFVHCGPLTCGFPFLVHGGVLGTLLYHAVHLARQVPGDQHLGGTLQISYKRPTLVDQILEVETRREDGGVRARISSTRTGRTLVEGFHSDPK